MTAVQVRERADLTPDELLERLERPAPAPARARRRMPAPIRRDPHERRRAVQRGGETWRLGYLLDVIYTRDAWMHRVDIARATGHEMVLTPEHDGRIVADVVAEWARRHGQPFTLTLDGPAGGTLHARRRTASTSSSTPSSSAGSFRAAPRARACSSHGGAVLMEDHGRRDRRRDLPPVDLRARRRAGRVHLQPVPRRRRRAAAVPHRPAADVPAGVRGGRERRPVDELRWITFGHVEADECGSMNEWLAAAPDAAGRARRDRGAWCRSNDLADRPPRPLADGEVLDLGGKRVRHLDTPHVPHDWEARVLYEETTGHAAVRGPRSPPRATGRR